MRIITLFSICVGFAAVFCITGQANAAQKVQRTMDTARFKAIHECSVSSAKYPEYVWGNVKLYVYRACMAAHGQPE